MNKYLLWIALGLTLIIGASVGIVIYKKYFDPPRSDRATLEKILKIKELHLVKHVYEDMFFLHRKNNPNKSVRAIAQVPVEINGFINLNDAKIIKKSDSVHHIQLPSPQIDEPNYQIDKMIVKSVKKFQFHMGSDLYSDVLKYVQEIVDKRKESIKQKAIKRNILKQTEEEAIVYFKSILLGFDMEHIDVVIDQSVVDKVEISRGVVSEDDSVEFITIEIENLEELMEGH
ncbi:DUF4230 domain-containing protein [uncultured Aquimarina sp.]|uniref:DUF4230 domain-containing protein n=1 Tax=uncultured Aquimarina sp. TaxID=575652 RepID=UPI00262BA438|nr:DUF4230 domain-containing protein [uncultured Aquimarina sp.]